MSVVNIETNSYNEFKDKKNSRASLVELIKNMAKNIGRPLGYQDDPINFISYEKELADSLIENNIIDEDEIFKIIKNCEIKNKSFWSSYATLFYKNPKTNQIIEVEWNWGRKPTVGFLIGDY